MTLLKKQRRNNGDSDTTNAFSSIIEDFFNESIPAWAGYTTNPRVNIREKSKQFNIEMAVPGFKKDDFQVELVDNVLKVSAKRKEVKEEEDEGFTRREFDYNSFCRSFTLPEAVKAESIKCNYENGLLHISVPKMEGEHATKKNIAVS